MSSWKGLATVSFLGSLLWTPSATNALPIVVSPRPDRSRIIDFSPHMVIVLFNGPRIALAIRRPIQTVGTGAGLGTARRKPARRSTNRG